MGEQLHRMVATDDNGDPIYGPWEDKRNADKRVEDVKSDRRIVSARTESR